jgi:hypothetical protein
MRIFDAKGILHYILWQRTYSEFLMQMAFEVQSQPLDLIKF